MVYYQVYYIGKSAAIFHNLKINNCDVRFFLINLETQFAKKESVIYNQKDASHGSSFYLSIFGYEFFTFLFLTLHKYPDIVKNFEWIS